MNTVVVDELLGQMDDIAKDISTQIYLLNSNLQRLQIKIRILNYQLGTLGIKKKPDVH